MTNTFLAAGLVLFVLWILGLITSYTLGGGIHILLIFAVIFIVVWMFNGRKK